MKKLFIVLMFFPLFSLAQKTVPGFIINGKLDGYADGTEIRLVKNGESVEYSKTTLQNGKFVLKGNVKEPVLFFVMIGTEKPVELYVENKTISFKADKSQPNAYTVEGSASHKDFSDFISVFVPVAQQLSAQAAVINYTPPDPARDSMMNIYNGMQQRIQADIDKLVAKKPTSVIVPFVLNVTYQFNDDVMMLERRFNMLDAQVKNMESGKQLQDFIAQNKIGAIGTHAMDFTQPDTTGAPVSLSSFKGKYVLVDFWASWCTPCRRENPVIVEAYNLNKGKNFTILSVSLDKYKDKWLQAIQEDKLGWTHVSDLQQWSNAVAIMYRVGSIPQNFLIDPQGKIIAKNLRGDQLKIFLAGVFR